MFCINAPVLSVFFVKCPGPVGFSGVHFLVSIQRIAILFSFSGCNAVTSPIMEGTFSLSGGTSPALVSPCDSASSGERRR